MPKKPEMFGPQRVAMSDRLRRWRLEQNLSLTDVESKSGGVGQSTIAAWEHGSMPNVLQAAYVCRALGHTVEELVEGL